MTFNSYLFVLFFPIVVSIHFAIAQRWQWLWLIAASCFFYAAFIPVYLLVLLWLIIIDFFAALLIEKTQGKRRTIFLWVSLCSTCSVLFFFKYCNFFNTSAAFLLSHLGFNYPVKMLSIILPLGLSFHTFQSLGYVIDVYHGKVKAERHFGFYALYVMFFPQLVAGPIERAYHLLPQLKARHSFDAQRVSEGLRLMLWGMFKKVVIADRLALVVNQVYGHPADFGGLGHVIAMVFFSFQIYCDFSGYSDLAIGSAKVMGYDLRTNFARPYFSASIAEFWQRWHMSLSTWFRDYVYIPLGGNRVSRWRWRFNILITFMLSGLWHGANITFVIWGLGHGIFYILSATAHSWLEKRIIIPRLIKIVLTFTFVSLAWIFFRAESLSDAVLILSQLANDWGKGVRFGTAPEAIGLTAGEFIFALALILFLIVAERFAEKIKLFFTNDHRPVALRWAVCVVATLMIMNCGMAVSIPFIYFQF